MLLFSVVLLFSTECRNKGVFIMTLEASLSVTEGTKYPRNMDAVRESTLKECPNSLTMGDPSRVGFSLVTHSVGARFARTHGY